MVPPSQRCKTHCHPKAFMVRHRLPPDGSPVRPAGDHPRRPTTIPPQRTPTVENIHLSPDEDCPPMHATTCLMAMHVRCAGVAVDVLDRWAAARLPGTRPR